MLDLSVIRDIVAILGVIAALSYYVIIVRSAQKARRTDAFMRLYQSRYRPETHRRFWELMRLEWEDFDDFMMRYGFETNPEIATLGTSLYSEYDGIGMLVQDNVVDLETVYRMMSASIVMAWYKYETIIKGLREMENGPGPRYFENFEYLANELIRMRRENGDPLPISYLHPTSTLHPELKA
jgi:hypothetical protein